MCSGSMPAMSVALDPERTRCMVSINSWKSGSPDVFQSGHRSGDVADGQAGHRLDDGSNITLGGEFCQRRELVESAAEIGVQADGVYPGNT